jgi:hypothetical protein
VATRRGLEVEKPVLAVEVLAEAVVRFFIDESKPEPLVDLSS